MGMLRRGLGAFAGALGKNLEQDYRTSQEVAAKKDLASYEAELRMKVQEAQNAWQGGQNDASRAQAEKFHGENLARQQARDAADNALRREEIDISGRRADAEARNAAAARAEAAARLRLAQEQFELMKQNKDLSAADKAKVDVVRSQLTAAEKAYADAIDDAGRKRALERITLLTDSLSGIFAPGKPLSFDPNAPKPKDEPKAKPKPDASQTDPAPGPASEPPSGGGNMGASLYEGLSKTADRVGGMLSTLSPDVERGQYLAMKRSVEKGLTLSPEAQRRYEELRRKFERE